MVTNYDDYLLSLKNYVGERNDDESIKIIEDFVDSFNGNVAVELEEMKAKYDELDKTWRDKYKARFFGEEEPPKGNINDNGSEENSVMAQTYDSLFTTKNKKEGED